MQFLKLHKPEPGFSLPGWEEFSQKAEDYGVKALTERRNFDRHYVQSQLENLAQRLERRTTVYVAGGAALALTGLKEATKDIDVVVRSRVEANSLLTGLRRLGYRDPRRFLTVCVRRMHARALRENSDGFRWDVFEKAAAGRLVLSRGMVERAHDYGIVGGRLRVRLLSKEDIFLLKSVTDREGDLEDMRVIAESSLNWAVIAQECLWQASPVEEDLGECSLREASGAQD